MDLDIRCFKFELDVNTKLVRLAFDASNDIMPRESHFRSGSEHQFDLLWLQGKFSFVGPTGMSVNLPYLGIDLPAHSTFCTESTFLPSYDNSTMEQPLLPKIPHTPRKRLSRDDRVRILTLRDDAGWKWKDIVEKMGCSVRAVQYTCEKHQKNSSTSLSRPSTKA